MEIPVIAEADGTVRAVKVAPADVVQEGDVLLELVARRTARRRRASRQRGRDSNPRLTSLPATAFKAVPIGHSGTPPCPPAYRRHGHSLRRARSRTYSEPPSSSSTSS